MILVYKSLLIVVGFVVSIGFHDFVIANSSPKYNLKLIKLPHKEVVLKIPVDGEDRFYIDYIHSKDKTPVHDVFFISKKGKLIILEEQYEWYGAGLEFHPKGVGKIRTENGHTRVLLNKELDQFLLRVGRIANHILSIKSICIPLISIANGGDLLEFVVENRTEGKDDNEE